MPYTTTARVPMDPLSKSNCAAFPEGVIESELFGHEKGAFTGAVGRRMGRFEMVDDGSVFLDEVGELSPLMQVRLLRVLQEREFERVGGSETLRVDVRVVAATNSDLEAMIAEGRFRQDLYYRLNVFPIHVPPLRDRRADIIELANHFLTRYGEKNNKRINRISPVAVDMLARYHWPGNVRELENCIERAVLLSNDDAIHSYHLPATLQTPEQAEHDPSDRTLQGVLDNVKREMIVEALRENNGNQAQSAAQLGITERIMGLRVKNTYRPPPV